MVVTLLFLAGILSTILGIIVLVGQPRRLVSWFFLGTTLSTALWAVGVGAFLLFDNPSSLLRIAQIYYIAAAGIALFMMLTTFSLIGKVRSWLYGIVSVPFVAIAGAIAFMPEVLIREISVSSSNIVHLEMGFYLLYIGYFVGYYLMTLIYLLVHVLGNKHHVAYYAQLKTILYAYGLAGLVGMLFNLFLPATGNYSLIWLGPLCLFIFVPMVYFAIAKQQLFDIKLAFVRSSAYVLSLAALSLLYFGLVYVISEFILRNGSQADVAVNPTNIAIALLLAFLFQPIKSFFNHLTNKIFYRDRYDPDEFISAIGRIVTSKLHLNELLTRTLDEITKTLKASSGTFIVYRDHHEDMLAGALKREDFSSNEYEAVRTLTRAGIANVIVIEAAHQAKRPESFAHDVLARKRISLVLPLRSANEIIGYLLLGEQLGSHYSKRDIKALETVANELVIGIMNARSVQVVRDLNKHLEERIEHATKELRRSNKRLLELDKTKDEFLSMASHQLRTPLTSVKGYISMVLEGDVGSITPAQRQLLQEAYGSSERMVHLIGDFLNVSRLQTGKFIIDPHLVNLSTITKQEVEGMQQIATTHNITIRYRAPARFPELYLDEGKIRQVIMNFIDNAIYYSPEGKDIKVTLGVEDGNAVVRVIDKGMGVPSGVQKKLFTKFFRADNARKQRPDGTGIGLYLAKKVIDGHKGTLLFESEEEKGSTFGFRLPIKKLTSPPAPQLVEE